MSDPVNPDHYRGGKFETVDVADEIMASWEKAPEDKRPTIREAHYAIESLKYLWRAPFKDGWHTNLGKAIWYLRMAIGDDPRSDRENTNVD